MRWTCLAFLLAGFVGLSFSHAQEQRIDERYRPQFHFSPPRGWMNDPNGLVYENGEWHLFYQHNAASNNWISELSWGHAVSKDLLHWKNLADVLPPTPRPGKGPAGSWSGTGFVDFNNSSGFGKGGEKPILLTWTAAGLGQCLAYSTDHGRTFTPYEQNPIIPMDPPRTGDWDRDPRVFWHEPSHQWVMVFSISGQGMVFYNSDDLKHWMRKSLFGGLFECPDIFQLPVDGNDKERKWVIWDAAGKYFIGQFDGKAFTRESGPFILDHGRNYYAAQSWSDAPDGRRVSIGWMRGGQYPGMPFNGQMGIPSELALRTTRDGMRLTKLPVKEVESLRYEPSEWKDLDLGRGNNPLGKIKGDLLDIEALIEPRNVSQVVLRVRGVTVRVTPDLLWVNDAVAPVGLVDGKVKLRVLVDRTSIEVFANDGLASISNCYLSNDNAKGAELFAEQGVAKVILLRAWKLKSVWGDQP